MCYDKFAFGLCDKTICTELLKTHLSDGTTKGLGWDVVVAEVKSIKSAQKTNKLIIDTTKQRNWRSCQLDRSREIKVIPEKASWYETEADTSQAHVIGVGI